MSSSEFVKGSCSRCGGHLEFPAEAVGQSAPCPHCGQTTGLFAAISPEKPRISGRKRQAIAVAIALCAVIPSILLALHKTGNTSGSGQGTPAIGQSNAPAVTKAPAGPKPEAETNDFAIMPYKLDKTPGSTLVYVTGTVRNLAGQQRFGVKLEFSLFDTNDNYLGAATDYRSVLSTNGVWQFKAMVMASKTTYARFSSIAGDK